MKDINYLNINNFSEWVELQLDFYSSIKYKDKQFTIDDLCNSESDCDDTDLTLSDLYSIEENIIVEE
jgi:hypothetical protein|tara:strand:+ start:210 stop:410 length:201 start_codon:yes stop_codon:yes gene_type:complete